MKKTKQIYCCDMIKDQVLKVISEIDHYGDNPISYNQSIRSFSLRVCPWERNHKGNEIEAAYEIKFCPWCGKKFPKDLAKERSKTINKEHICPNPCDGDDNHIPAEFFSDEWWKKRGL